MEDYDTLQKTGVMEYIIIYDLSKNDLNGSNTLRIFGEEFVKNNKDNEDINIMFDKDENGKPETLKEFLDLNEISDKFSSNNLLKLKLIGINSISNFSNMFSECHSLISVTSKSSFITKESQNSINLEPIKCNENDESNIEFSSSLSSIREINEINNSLCSFNNWI